MRKFREFLSSVLGVFVVFATICVFAFLISVQAATASTITVTNLNDSGIGSFRQAIADAAASDTIEFSVSGTITLTSGQLTINKDLTISGPGEDQLTISGNNNSRVFEIPGGVYDISITDLTIADGSTASNGGGIKNASIGPVTLEDVTFSGNSADNNGGGMYNSNLGNPTLINTIFSGNSAVSGGGMYNLQSNPSLINVLFFGNSANYGGGIYNEISNPALKNATFSGNSAVFGGGMFNYMSNPMLINSIFWGNTAVNGAQILNHTHSNPNISESDIQDSGGSYYWDDLLGTDGGGNIDADPLFVSEYDDLRLQPGSPAIDVGTNTDCPATDMDGNTRPYGQACDMGAFEIHYPMQYYVDADATGAATGLSWTDAFTTVQDALTRAHYGIHIWVAEGVYYPDEGRWQIDGDRESTFRLKEGMEFYGGFDPGSGADELNERDWIAYPTVLSGDIDGNDINNDGNFIAEDTDDIRGGNAYHVVYNSYVDGVMLMDGFIITAGKANEGGNVLGGGMYNQRSSPKVTNVAFYGNYASGAGGGMFNGEDYLLIAIRVTNVIFSGNSADRGGGMYNADSHPKLTNVIFSNNTAKDGGAMGNQESNPVLTNVTFANNWAADDGGGIYNFLDSAPSITNAIFWGNIATSGGQIFNTDTSTPTIIQSDIQSSGGSVNWDTSLGIDGGSNIDADPLYVSEYNDLHLQAGSPAIDTGKNSSCPATDLDGTSRPINGTCDMGAYEYINLSPTAVDDIGASFATDKGTAFTTASVLSNDTDPNGDTLSIQSFNTTGTQGLVSDNGDGSFDYDPDGKFDHLGKEEQATDTFSYTVSDSHGGTDSATVTITIYGGNAPPTAVDDPATGSEAGFTTDENTPFTTASVLTNDIDPNRDAIFIESFDTTGTQGLVSDIGDGSFDYDPDGQFEILASGENATDTFSYTVSDGEYSDTATVTITIKGLQDDFDIHLPLVVR